MKTAVRIAWCIIGAFIGVLIGSAIWRYWDFKQHPEIYMLNSAPWYTSLLLQGIITLVIIAVCLIVIVVMNKKSK